MNDELACNGERVPNKGFCWSLEDGLKKDIKERRSGKEKEKNGKRQQQRGYGSLKNVLGCNFEGILLVVIPGLGGVCDGLSIEK